VWRLWRIKNASAGCVWCIRRGNAGPPSKSVVRTTASCCVWQPAPTSAQLSVWHPWRRVPTARSGATWAPSCPGARNSCKAGMATGFSTQSRCSKLWRGQIADAGGRACCPGYSARRRGSARERCFAPEFAQQATRFDRNTILVVSYQASSLFGCWFESPLGSHSVSTTNRWWGRS
jgi:hypothetical protein